MFVLGLAIGSFLNVVIYRLPRGMGFVKGRSFCPKCKKKINWFDNVPVISFLILKGHCRFCNKPISFQYPLIELLTGILFYLSYLSHLNFLYYPLLCGLIVIFFIDLEHKIIPDKIVLPLIIIFTIYAILTADYWLLLSAAGAFLFLFLIWLATKGKGMGFGDVKLAFLMGLVLGFPNIILAFYIAFLTGAFIGIILILGRKAKFGKPIPFGPFLAFATTLSYLWGENIIKAAEKLLF